MVICVCNECAPACVCTCLCMCMRAGVRACAHARARVLVHGDDVCLFIFGLVFLFVCLFGFLYAFYVLFVVCLVGWFFLGGVVIDGANVSFVLVLVAVAVVRACLFCFGFFVLFFGGVLFFFFFACLLACRCVLPCSLL